MKKKSKKQKPETPHSSKKEHKQVNTQKQKSTDSLVGFYLKAVILAFGCFILFYFILVHGYVDMIQAGKISYRIQNKQAVSPEERQIVVDAQPYQKSLNFKLFHNYKWVYHNLLKRNLEIIHQYDTFNLDQKHQYKSGVDYNYIRILKEKTDENAVILMPDVADLIMPENAPKNTPQFKMVSNKAWATYFLYPRTLVYDGVDGLDSLNGKANIFKDPNYAENRKKVTHVAIIYGRGYEHLEYPVSKREYYNILPIRQQNNQ